MAGGSLGMQRTTLVGLRVAATPTYIPGYEKNGQTIQQLLKVPVILNDKSRKEVRKTYFTISIWGKLADSAAKSLSIGKEFHCDVRIDSYDAKVWNKNRELVLNPDGTPVTTKKHSFVCETFRYGEDSQKFITEDIARGKRPQNWNDGSEEGRKAWLAVIETRKNDNKMRVKDGKTVFGHAEVRQNGQMYNGGKMVQAPEQTATLQTQVANAADNSAVNQVFGNTQNATADDGNPF